MAIKTSGPLALTEIVAEFGGGAPHSLSEYFAGGGLVPSGTPGIPTGGTISFSQFYGASNVFVFNRTLTGTTTNYNLRNDAINSGWNGSNPLTATVTINPGVFVNASSTGVYAFSTGSPFPSGSSLRIVNNGTIIGRGGNGGSGAVIPFNSSANGNPGGTGGPGLLVQYPTTLQNAGRISGGGGGGGGGASSQFNFEVNEQPYSNQALGGGGGGGIGVSTGGGGQAGAGQNGTLTSAGSGGAGRSTVVSGPRGPSGGAGGSYGASGGPAPQLFQPFASTKNGGGGGGAGNAIVGNNRISYQQTGTRNGPIVG